MDKTYYLLDLERTIGTGFAWYWKPNRRGYTTELNESGLYREAIAKEIVGTDFDKTTIMISKDVVKNILEK